MTMKPSKAPSSTKVKTARVVTKYDLRQIRRAMLRWQLIWFKGRNFEIDWHNFKWDLKDGTK